MAVGDSRLEGDVRQVGLSKKGGELRPSGQQHRSRIGKALLQHRPAGLVDAREEAIWTKA